MTDPKSSASLAHAPGTPPILTVSRTGFSPDPFDVDQGSEMSLQWSGDGSEIQIDIYSDFDKGEKYDLFEGGRNPYPVSSTGTTYTVKSTAPVAPYTIAYDDKRPSEPPPKAILRGTINVKKPKL
jgi:hypothetical protein